jgi:hypothetical protein
MQGTSTVAVAGTGRLAIAAESRCHTGARRRASLASYRAGEAGDVDGGRPLILAEVDRRDVERQAAEVPLS